MQILCLFLLAVISSFTVVFGTQYFLYEKRSTGTNRNLVALGIILCLIFSVLAEVAVQAKKPTFYYHTHALGPASLKMFGLACCCSSFFYALILMLSERKRQKNPVVSRVILSVLIAGCGSVLLETAFFNFRHFELINSGTQEITFPPDRMVAHGLYFNRASWKYHPYSWEIDHKLVIYPNNKIRNIYLPLNDGTGRMSVRIGFDDAAHRNYEFVPEHELDQNIPRSLTVPIHTVGKTYSVEIDLPGVKNHHDDPSYGIAFPEISFNHAVPLDIKLSRLSLVFFVLFLAAAFFPGSPLWMLPLNFHSVPQMAAVFGSLCLVFVWFAWTVFSSYTGTDRSFSEQKGALNDNVSQYNKLIEALMNSRYALLDIPDHNFEQLDDPYDMYQRERKQFSYPWDTVYYQGRFYVYFGIVPAAAVLLPYRLLTGSYLELDYPILGFCILFVVGVYGVYSWIVKQYFRDLSFGLFWTGLLLLVSSMNLTWCLRRTLVYELAITAGICFAVWAIYFLLLAETSRMRRLFLFLSGTCASLAVGCRPTMLFVSAVLFTVMLSGFRISRCSAGRRITDAGLFLLPYILIGFALMKYNYERFGNPFEFGITYQLTTENRAVGIPLLGFFGRLLSILASLFTFPSVNLVFPFIHLQKPDLPYNGMILNSDMVLGVFAYPVMAFLILIPVFRTKLNGKGRFLMPFFISCLAAAAAICITASSFAVVNRYLTDFLYLAAIPAVFSLICFCEKCNTVRWHKLGQTAAFICSAIGICLFAALSLTGEENWFRQINPQYFERLRYAFSPWL